jgi:hypothetical protein
VAGGARLGSLAGASVAKSVVVRVTSNPFHMDSGSSVALKVAHRVANRYALEIREAD